MYKPTTEEFEALQKIPVRVTCTDGEEIEGIIIDWTSAANNEPDGESLTLMTKDCPCLEVYFEEIEDIKLVSND